MDLPTQSFSIRGGKKPEELSKMGLKWDLTFIPLPSRRMMNLSIMGMRYEQIKSLSPGARSNVPALHDGHFRTVTFSGLKMAANYSVLL
jgi:hypothetical protein